MLLLQIIEMFALYNNVLAEMEGFIVGGEEVAIEKYPHSAFLEISCSGKNMLPWSCGASIISQNFTLTAAHCLISCTKSGFIAVSVGHQHKQRGFISSAYKIKTHKAFGPELEADIGLVRLKTPLKFSRKIQQATLMRNPPHEEVAYVAGWGVVSEGSEKASNLLKHAAQPLWSNEKCNNLLEDIPLSNICAGTENGPNFAAVGDSGSALVIRGHIQIGIVSYRMPDIAKSLVVYTNVTYYYDWIHKTMTAMSRS